MSKECFELVLRNWDRDICVMFLLILLPAEADLVPKEGRDKKNLGRLRSFSGSKIVFTLLTKVVAVHWGLSAIYVWGTGLQLPPRYLENDKSWGGSGNGSASL